MSKETSKFESFLRNRLKTIVGASIIDHFFTPEAMKVWLRAFTDQTYSADNYELYEIIGDSAISLAFYDIIREAFPDVAQPKIYSTLKEFHVSEAAFSDLATKAGFLEFLRAAPVVLNSNEMKKKIAEDLWESYHGALKELGDQIGLELYDIEIGYKCVKNSMIEVMNNTEIDKDRGAGAFKNQLSEIASTLGIKFGTINFFLATDRKVAFAYVIRRDALKTVLKRFNRTDEDIENIINDVENSSRRYLQDVPTSANIRNISLNRKEDIVVGRGIGDTRDEAQDRAASEAVKTFRNVYGMTNVYLDNIRAERLDNHLQQDGKIKQAYDVIQSVYSDIKISGRTFPTSALYILTGVKNGKTKVITTLVTEKNLLYERIQASIYLKAADEIKEKRKKNKK